MELFLLQNNHKNLDLSSKTTPLVAEFQKTELDIWNHSREGKSCIEVRALDKRGYLLIIEG